MAKLKSKINNIIYSWKSDDIRDAEINAINKIYGAHNLFTLSNISGEVAGGVTVTVNDDGSITFQGVPTFNYDLYGVTEVIPKGTYLVGTNLTLDMYSQIEFGMIAPQLGWSVLHNQWSIWTNSQDQPFNYYFHFKAGTDLTTPVTIYPMMIEESFWHGYDPNWNNYWIPPTMTNKALTKKASKIGERFGGNLDNLFESGLYVTTGEVTGTPNDSDYRFQNAGLMVMGLGSAYSYQLLFDTRNTIYTRICNNGTWTSWKSYVQN